MTQTSALPTAATHIDTAAAAPLDMSIIGLVMRADIIVQSVMVILVLLSIISWAIMLDRGLLLWRLRRQLNQFENVFWSGQPLEELYRRLEKRPEHPAAYIFVEVIREWKRCCQDNFSAEFTRQRISTVIDLMYSREMGNLENRLSFLATVGSVGPFIGLFGTVWGIMNSFTAIATTQNTSLNVVAPGIAEALFVTALGLIAAIPALMAYNKIASEINKYGLRIDAFAEELAGVLAKQQEQRNITAAA